MLERMKSIKLKDGKEHETLTFSSTEEVKTPFVVQARAATSLLNRP